MITLGAGLFIAAAWNAFPVCGMDFSFVESRSSGAFKLAATVACDELRGTLGTIVTSPADPNYTTLADENWSQTAWKLPTCIVLPTTTAETQEVVKILVANNVSFAIRSGGHSPNPFDANINDGVLISTEMLNNQVSYDPSTNSVSFGTGLRWDTVYSALDPYNVTLVGGRVMTVGVGGLILGSGLSYLSDLYGMVCDNVLSFEVSTLEFQSHRLARFVNV